MSVNIRPVDGLIYRLLQQNNKPASNTGSQPAKAVGEHVNISSQARDEHEVSAVEAQIQGMNVSRERNLESHLLALYKSNDLYGG